MERYIHTYIQSDMAFFSAYAIISFALRARNKNLKKNQEIANHYGYLKKKSIPSVENPILGNAAKISFLHKLLSRISKLLVGTLIIHSIGPFSDRFW